MRRSPGGRKGRRVEHWSYSEYAISQERSVDRVRRSCGVRNTSNPNDMVQFLQGMGGGGREYLHHDLVNFDVIARSNTATFKEQLCGRAGHRMA